MRADHPIPSGALSSGLADLKRFGFIFSLLLLSLRVAFSLPMLQKGKAVATLSRSGKLAQPHLDVCSEPRSGFIPKLIGMESQA
jgi:hypothetical protein